MLNHHSIIYPVFFIDSLIKISKLHHVPQRGSPSGTTIKARWQSGYAADCKSVDLGSTPGRASIQNDMANKRYQDGVNCFS